MPRRPLIFCRMKHISKLISALGGFLTAICIHLLGY